jgi:hypothetical protein
VASVNPILTLGTIAVLVLAAAVSGCATTQDANERASVQADRTLESRKPLRMHGTARSVEVVRTAVVNGKDGSAVVVVLRNRGSDPVNDLPIEVGPRGGAPLNAAANVPYFQSHAPAIAPGAEATWVYVTKQRLHSDGAYVKVGAPAAHPVTVARHVSDLEIADERRAGSNLHARVINGTGIPQYDLDVYAVAVRGGRYVAAGRVSLAHLGVDSSADLTFPLVGDARGGHVQVFAPQTLFQ